MTLPGESQPEPEIPSIEEMRDALLARVYDERKSLNGNALVQALKALAVLAQQEKAEPAKANVAEPHSLLDQIQNVPAAHARKLLAAEIGRLEAELAAHQAALLELKGK